MPKKFDLVLKGGRVIDPAQAIDGAFDVAVADGKIAAIGPNLPAAAETVDVSGALVLPGMIDTHAHVFRHVTGRFGLDADMVGVQSGVTALVDQGGPSLMTFPAFRSYVVEKAATRVYAFLSAYCVGGMEGHYYPELYGPHGIDVDGTVKAADANRDLVKGIKAHAEIGGFSRWGIEAFRLAKEISRQTRLPLYIHFGQLCRCRKRGAARSTPTASSEMSSTCWSRATSSPIRSPGIPAASSGATASCTRWSRKRWRVA